MKPKISYAIGMRALKNKEISYAEDVFKQLIENDPNDLKSRFALAKLYYDINEPFKARATFNQIVENTSDRMQTFIELGKNCIDKNNFDQAGDALEDAQKLLTPNRNARDFLKLLYKQAGENDKLAILEEEEAIITDLEFRAQFDLGNLRSRGFSKKEAKQYLDSFMTPHTRHLPNDINFLDLLNTNFETLDFSILPSIISNKPYVSEWMPENMEEQVSKKRNISNSARTIDKPLVRRSGYPQQLSIRNRLKHLMEKNPSHGYQGKDKFAGYIIFEYADKGVCVLEKLFTQTKDKKIRESSSNATYIFPAGMTLSLSQYSKRDIISMMKTQSYIKRVVHSKNYYSNLEKAMKDVNLSYKKHRKAIGLDNMVPDSPYDDEQR